MNRLIVKNDIKRNKIINLALLLFMMFSASLAVLSTILGVETFTAISDLYKVAQPPHFLQMHKGELAQTKIDDFMSSYEGLTHWQIQTMINIYGESLTVISDKGTYDLGDIHLDIGLVKQNVSRDLLLDNWHNKVILNQGEIGIPVLLRNQYDIKVGDKIVLNSEGVTKKFVIKEFILDSQMNSSMTSSTRILLSDEDFNLLADQIGEKEYLIEAYFTKREESPSFQTAYENANLPNNGPSITYSMIFLLSAMTDITMVFILLFVSLLLIIISFICVKFTIMAALEEEIGEIGTMKAIGLTYRDIRSIYLNKYKILSMIGVILGFILAIIVSGVVTKHISETFGNIGLSTISVVLSFLVASLVFLIINYYCKKVLKKVKKLTVVDALVTRKGFDKNNIGVKDILYKSKKMNVNWLMGIVEVFYKFKDWAIIFAVVLISVVMILVPINLINTFEAPEFITYMGSSLEDILIEVENGKNLGSNYLEVKKILENDDSISNYNEYRRIRVQTIDIDNEVMNLHIDSGHNSGIDLQYLSGVAPKTKNEIAISYLNAEKTGKNTGDKLALWYNDKDEVLTISGIYQDVTNGGYSAKSRFSFPDLESNKYSFSVNIDDKLDPKEKAIEWSNSMGLGVAVYPMGEFIDQTLGGVINQLRKMVLVIVIIGFFMATLITVLFLKLRLAKDFSQIAIMKAIGFSYIDIKKQYLIKIGGVALMGIIAGIVLTNSLATRFVDASLAISGLGIKSVKLIVNPLTQYIICPILLMLLILFVTNYVLNIIKKYNIISLINE